MSGHTTTRRRLPHGQTTALSIGSLLSAFRNKDLSPRPPLLRGEGESNEVLRKHEKGRQECLPHLQTRFRDGSRIQKSHCAAVEMMDSRINQLTVTIHELIRLSSNRGHPPGAGQRKELKRTRAAPLAPPRRARRAWPVSKPWSVFHWGQ